MNNAFTPNAGFQPPQLIRPSGHQSALKIILAVFAVMFAALLALVVLLLIGAETGPVELIIGLICATLPVPIYVMLLLWIVKARVATSRVRTASGSDRITQ